MVYCGKEMGRRPAAFTRKGAGKVMSENIKQAIQAGKTALGLELGSTRIKAVLIGEDHSPIASGSFDWENRLENGVWTYHMDEVWQGIQGCYRAMKEDVQAKYGVTLKGIGAIGMSAMMHGYLPFSQEGRQLAAFRTWRNTITGQASQELTQLFGFNIPQRWSIAHLYQAILNGEEHVKDIGYLTTLAGYVHWKLTGRKVLGVGEASGMFPIDSGACDYDQVMVDKFDALIAGKGFAWKLRDILPQVLPAGAEAGALTPEGPSCWTPAATWPRHPPVPSRGRRGHRHDSHQQCSPAHGQRIGGHLGIRHGGAGKAPVPGASGNRHGHHPQRQARGHGPLQQLHLRPERLGGPVRRIRPGHGHEGGYERPVLHPVQQGHGGRQGLRRAAGL